MSVRDGQRLEVSGSVSVRAKCLVSHIYSEVCWLGFQIWSLAGRLVERSVTALFSSRSFLITDFQLFHNFTVFLDVTPCGLVYSFKNVFEENVAGSWVHRYIEGCESCSYHSLVSLLADSCLTVDTGGSLLVASSAVNFEQQWKERARARACVRACRWEGNCAQLLCLWAILAPVLWLAYKS
jgi:hypothetical protein